MQMAAKELRGAEGSFTLGGSEEGNYDPAQIFYIKD